MRLAACAWPIRRHAGMDAWAAAVEASVDEAAGQGAELLVFPEYGWMDLSGPSGAVDMEGVTRAAAEAARAAAEVIGGLARSRGVWIVAGSAPESVDGVFVNRARLFGPAGQAGHQDKQVMTRYEREVWDIRPGGGLGVFDTDLGRLGILICYDAEFPALGRALVEAGAEIIAVPSCTDSLAGYWRVRVGAMARALEGQCPVVHAVTVGDAPWCPPVDENRGAAAVYGPPDIGFPDTGVIAEGKLDAPGWVTADVERSAIGRVRAEGRVLNVSHWPEAASRAAAGLRDFADSGPDAE